MKYNPAIHHCRSIRLKGHDYSSAGAYFVTLVLQHRLRLFGAINENGMQLSSTGAIARQCWEDIPIHFPYVALDEFVIMPDHMHGIIVIRQDDDNHCRGLINQAPTNHISTNQSDWMLMKNPKRTLGKIVRWYKARAAKMIHDSGENMFQWQRNYYEHIIRNEHELLAIQKYILNNPAQWQCVREN